MENCRLVDTNMTELARIFNGVKKTTTKEDVNSKVAQWNTAPKPIIRSEVGTPVFEVSEGWKACPDTPRPSWLPTVVKHRVEFAGTVWILHCDGSTSYYCFLLAVQSPYQIYFAPVRLIGNVGGAGGGAGSSADAAAPLEGMTRWLVPAFDFCDWSQLPQGDGVHIEVFPKCKLVGDMVLQTVEKAALLDDFTAGLPELPPPSPKKKPKANAKAAAGIDPALLARYPWLATDQSCVEASTASAGGDKDGDDDDEEVLVDEEGRLGSDGNIKEPKDLDAAALFDELEAKRKEWVVLGVGDDCKAFFKVAFLKGKWTREHRGVAYDRTRGFASGKAVQN